MALQRDASTARPGRDRLDLVTTFGLSEKYRGFPEYQQAAAFTRAGRRVRAFTYAETAGEWGHGGRESVAGADVWRVARHGWWSPQLVRAIANDRPAVLHLHHWSNQFAYAARLTCRPLGVPYVVTPHGMLHDRFLVDDRDRPYARPLDPTRLIWRVIDLPRLVLRNRAPRRALRNYLTHQPLLSADLVVALSQAEAALLRQLGLPADRVTVIPNGIDLTFADGDDAAAWRQRWSGPVVLFLGQLKLRKGWDLFLQAMPAVLREHPTATFVLTTHSAALPPAFTRLVADLGVGERLQVLQRVSEEEKARLYRAADVLCLPTRYEGFGLPVAEAMAAGCPVVVTKLPVIDEMVQDGHDALLAPYDDAVGLAQTLNRALADPALRQRLAANGRQTVQRFAIDRVAADLLAAYDRLVAARRGRR